MTPRKLAFLTAACIATSAATLALSRLSRRVPESRPLDGLEPASVARVELTRGGETTVLENREGVWRLSSPVEDRADAAACRALVWGLSALTLGSEVSRDPAGYSDYGLDEAGAARVRLYARGAAAPILDAYFGKEASGPAWSYARLAREKPVYLASGFDRAALALPADAYRERALSDIRPETAEKVSLKAAGRSFRLAKSSAGWSGPGLAPGRGDALVARLFALRAVSFLPKPPPSAQTGLAAPVLEAEVSTTVRSSRLRIGRARPASADGSVPETRYAAVDGRPVVLLVPAEEASALLKGIR